jgi:hypothetical protein
MNTTTVSHPLLRGSSVVARLLISFAVVIAFTLSSEAATIRLENGNSVAQFRTENEPAFPGLHEWSVDNVNHVFQQWFYYRVGDAGGEATINSLTHQSSTAFDLTGDGRNDFLRSSYADPAGRFTIAVSYLLTGGTAGSNQSGLLESILIQNTSANPLPMHFFQYADFDLNNTSPDDALVITGTPRNTAHQTDPVMRVSESVTTPPPSHFEANLLNLPNNLVTRLNDGSPTTLADVSGPIAGDAAWAFQWDFEIPVGQSQIITKSKSIRTGEHIPEPGSIALVLTGLATAAVLRRRRITLPGKQS